jgi:hypothetical protein
MIPMHGYQLVYPMFALVLLTVIVLMTLFRRRVRAVSEGHCSKRRLFSMPAVLPRW